MSELSIVQNSFRNTQLHLDEFAANHKNLDIVTHFGKKLAQAFLQGNKVLSCGNGGSMCDAMHFAEEFTGRFREDRPSLPAIAISDPSYITCTGNDYGFDEIFSRFISGVGKKGDVLLGISTSGNSPNVVNAIKQAKEQGMYTVALLGKDGGQIKDLADLPIIVPGATSDRIQELHIKIIHISIEVAEQIVKKHSK
ncbi:MAG: D-sedoheptulose 7-phosphate isomerase [bacterium]|jgi:D-sedoheptulose 7-phosphate isomerase